MTTVHMDGLTWTDRPGSDDCLAFGRHEVDFTERMVAQHGDVFVDVGAHVGRYTVRLASTFKEVLAFEPSPIQRAGLEANLELNGITHVKVIPFGVWSEFTSLPFEEAHGQSRSGVGDETITVVPLDGLYTYASLVKIDVEGAEYEVLKGMARLMKSCKPIIAMELHEFINPALPDACRGILTKYGYRIEEMPMVGESRYWWAT